MSGSVRRVLLGLAFATAPGAALALERAPLPSEAPMEACPAQGAGFARIPGTSTCVRVSGRVAAGVDMGGVDMGGVDMGRGRTAAPLRGRLSIDARSQSDLGPVRSFLRIDAGAR